MRNQTVTLFGCVICTLYEIIWISFELIEIDRITMFILITNYRKPVLLTRDYSEHIFTESSENIWQPIGDGTRICPLLVR